MTIESDRYCLVVDLFIIEKYFYMWKNVYVNFYLSTTNEKYVQVPHNCFFIIKY